MKKQILTVIAGALMLIGTASLAYASNEAVKQEVTVTQTELTFSAIEIEEVPQVVLDAAVKEYEGSAVTAAHVAKKEDGKAVYKLMLKDVEGENVTALYNEDGSKFVPAPKE